MTRLAPLLAAGVSFAIFDSVHGFSEAAGPQSKSQALTPDGGRLTLQLQTEKGRTDIDNADTRWEEVDAPVADGER
jgi:hypothetical protein